jgi:hypothetical protein
MRGLRAAMTKKQSSCGSTVSHKKSKTRDRSSNRPSFEDPFLGDPIQLVDERINWQVLMLTFSPAAKMGISSNRISGTVKWIENDLTRDVDLNETPDFASQRWQGHYEAGYAHLTWDVIRPCESVNKDQL